MCLWGAGRKEQQKAAERALSASAAPVLIGTAAAPHSGASAPEVSMLRDVCREGASQSGSIEQPLAVLEPHSKGGDVRPTPHVLQLPQLHVPCAMCHVQLAPGLCAGAALLCLHTACIASLCMCAVLSESSKKLQARASPA